MPPHSTVRNETHTIPPCAQTCTKPAQAQKHKTAPEYTGAVEIKSTHRQASALMNIGRKQRSALLVYGRHIAASLEHGSKVTPCQRKLAF